MYGRVPVAQRLCNKARSKVSPKQIKISLNMDENQQETAPHEYDLPDGPLERAEEGVCVTTINSSGMPLGTITELIPPVLWWGDCGARAGARARGGGYCTYTTCCGTCARGRGTSPA